MDKKRFFQGADLIVSDSPVGAVSGKTIVVTRHAEALSREIFVLKDLYADRIDYQNKYGFYPALGQAALDYLAKNHDEAGLLEAVRTAAEKFWAE